MCPPPRRHLENNFAVKVAKEIGERLKIPFILPFACKNRERFNPIFVKNADIPYRNIILYDDIVTTGSTLCAMKMHIGGGVNILPICGIANQGVVNKKNVDCANKEDGGKDIFNIDLNLDIDNFLTDSINILQFNPFGV